MWRGPVNAPKGGAHSDPSRLRWAYPEPPLTHDRTPPLGGQFEPKNVLPGFEVRELEEDRAEEAKRVIESQGLIVTDKYGRSKEHPAVGIERQSRMAFLRAVKALNLDIEPPLGRLGGPGKHNRR